MTNLIVTAPITLILRNIGNPPVDAINCQGETGVIFSLDYLDPPLTNWVASGLSGPTNNFTISVVGVPTNRTYRVRGMAP